MAKMVIHHTVIITRPDKDDKTPGAGRMVLKPARRGQPPRVFDFKADEIKQIQAAHPAAISKPDEAVEVPALPAQGGGDGGTGDKRNDAKQENLSNLGDESHTDDPPAGSEGGESDPDKL